MRFYYRTVEICRNFHAGVFLANEMRVLQYRHARERRRNCQIIKSSLRVRN